MEDPLKVYSSLLSAGLEKLRKAMGGKKYAEFAQMCDVST
jgi:hypothetical protein